METIERPVSRNIHLTGAPAWTENLTSTGASRRVCANTTRLLSVPRLPPAARPRLTEFTAAHRHPGMDNVLPGLRRPDNVRGMTVCFGRDVLPAVGREGPARAPARG
jgi:hypothetical protein